VTVPRLSDATLDTVDTWQNVTGPRVDLDALTIGIVHFGIGAFHRAHQAVYTEDAAAATGDTGWGILGVTGRSDAVVRQLEPQDCLYGVLERAADATSLRLIGSVRDVAWPGTDSDRVVEMLSRPTTHLATMTITEKGYVRGPDGGIDLGLDAVRADIALIREELAAHGGVSASATPLGLLVRGLARRFVRGGAPFSVVACDNLIDNGPTTRRLVMSLVAAVGTGEPGTGQDDVARFAAWIEASVTFPSTMVDRIVPAANERDRDVAATMLGLWDEALVTAEPFRQWVIEDNFAGARPAWEKVGAIMTHDVAPYERVKLRVLNGAHSMLAYLGALTGYATIAETVADLPLRNAVLRVLDEDVLPTLEAPAGIDLEEYRDSVMQRFANPNLAHTTLQVGMDGSQKLPIRLLASAADRLAAGHVPRGLALAIAAWVTFVASTSDHGGPVLDDPIAAVLQAAVGDTDALWADPAGTVDRVFAVHQVFPPARHADSPEFRAAVVDGLIAVRALVASAKSRPGMHQRWRQLPEA
jgi:fructuronate reductase